MSRGFPSIHCHSMGLIVSELVLPGLVFSVPPTDRRLTLRGELHDVGGR